MHEVSEVFVMPSRGVAIFSQPIYVTVGDNQIMGT